MAGEARLSASYSLISAGLSYESIIGFLTLTRAISFFAIRFHNDMIKATDIINKA